MNNDNHHKNKTQLGQKGNGKKEGNTRGQGKLETQCAQGKTRKNRTTKTQAAHKVKLKINKHKSVHNTISITQPIQHRHVGFQQVQPVSTHSDAMSTCGNYVSIPMSRSF